jgi:hypothetical protein
MRTDEELLQAVKTAVRKTVAAVLRHHPKETLAGYALLTDDDLVTLTYMAVTSEAIPSAARDDFFFSPTDWPYEYEFESFDSATERLRQLSDARELSAHVELAFATVVQALAELRAEGVFAPEVFLSALSTDPSPQLLAMESASVERLNPAAIVEARNRFLARWAR